MAVSGLRLNRFERVLFWAALILGGILIVVRLGSAVILSYFHFNR